MFKFIRIHTYAKFKGGFYAILTSRNQSKQKKYNKKLNYNTNGFKSNAH